MDPFQCYSTTRADATKNKQEFEMKQIPLSLMKQSKNQSSYQAVGTPVL